MMKKLLCLSMVLILLCTVFTGFAEAMDPTEAIIAEFEKMTQIPRPSGYTDGISEYLAAWASERGFTVVRDETNNVIFDVPATTGMEDKPVVGLQVHMDMVFKNPDIDIVSIGPTVHSPHTINESCEIESFDKVWMLVEEIFRRIE